MQPNISLIASAVRIPLFFDFINSLKDTTEPVEVVFSGNKKPDGEWYEELWKTSPECLVDFKYIETENIKPAQCYEISRRNAIGEVVVWCADDCEWPNDILGKAYKYWKSKNNEKLILSLQTKESGYKEPEGVFDMNQHRFFGFCPDSPLMAPLAMISRNFLKDLGGFDRRYVCGQYENSCVMKAYQNGATVEIFGDKNCFIEIRHLEKSKLIGESVTDEDFLNRPFATSYNHDRKILENSWTVIDHHSLMSMLHQGIHNIPMTSIKKISKVQLDEHEPYSDDDLLTKSQSHKGIWE